MEIVGDGTMIRSLAVNYEDLINHPRFSEGIRNEIRDIRQFGWREKRKVKDTYRVSTMNTIVGKAVYWTILYGLNHGDYQAPLLWSMLRALGAKDGDFVTIHFGQKTIGLFKKQHKI